MRIEKKENWLVVVDVVAGQAQHKQTNCFFPAPVMLCFSFGGIRVLIYFQEYNEEIKEKQNKKSLAPFIEFNSFCEQQTTALQGNYLTSVKCVCVCEASINFLFFFPIHSFCFTHL